MRERSATIPPGRWSSRRRSGARRARRAAGRGARAKRTTWATSPGRLAEGDRARRGVRRGFAARGAAASPRRAGDERAVQAAAQGVGATAAGAEPATAGSSAGALGEGPVQLALPRPLTNWAPRVLFAHTTRTYGARAGCAGAGFSYASSPVARRDLRGRGRSAAGRRLLRPLMSGGAARRPSSGRRRGRRRHRPQLALPRVVVVGRIRRRRRRPRRRLVSPRTSRNRRSPASAAPPSLSARLILAGSASTPTGILLLRAVAEAGARGAQPVPLGLSTPVFLAHRVGAGRSSGRRWSNLRPLGFSSR